jgi:acyl carrier protein
METVETPADVASVVRELVTRDLAEFLDCQELAPDQPFDDLGVDSLVLVELAVSLTARFGVKFSDWEIGEAGSLQGTVRLVERKCAADADPPQAASSSST